MRVVMAWWRQRRNRSGQPPVGNRSLSPRRALASACHRQATGLIPGSWRHGTRPTLFAKAADRPNRLGRRAAGVDRRANRTYESPNGFVNTFYELVFPGREPLGTWRLIP